jgi:mono/diheme cytochrome c family protein
MKKLSLLFLFFTIPTFAADVRLERHLEATNAFENLNFFYKGRGMMVSPEVISIYEWFSDRGINTQDLGPLYQRWGLIVENNKVKGLFNEPYEGMNIGVLGCVACHGGKAAGEYIVGLGNKNVDAYQIGKDAAKGLQVWGSFPRRNPKFKEMHARSLEFTKALAGSKVGNETQGLVSTAIIRSWFYKIQNLPFPNNFPPGQVKVPHLWGYGEKRKSGSFWDGEGNGELGGWAIAVELYAGQTVANVREYWPKVHKAEDVLGDLLPPKYPFKIQESKVLAGKKIYETSCLNCHGSHERDLQGYPIYESPKHIPIRVVKTDPDRLKALSEELYQLIEKNPLNDVMRADRKPEHGYVAPKLWGIWSRFPYLHNASVSTIYDLLSPPETRPKLFSLKNAGERERFDEVGLGLNNADLSKATKRQTYDTSRVGHRNDGHFFESFKKLTHENKIELIEYLKTL